MCRLAAPAAEALGGPRGACRGSEVTRPVPPRQAARTPALTDRAANGSRDSFSVRVTEPDSHRGLKGYVKMPLGSPLKESVRRNVVDPRPYTPPRIR